MQKAGTVEAHIRKDQSFSWLVEVTDTVGRAFKSINWRQEFEHFFKVQKGCMHTNVSVHKCSVVFPASTVRQSLSLIVQAFTRSFGKTSLPSS